MKRMVLAVVVVFGAGIAGLAPAEETKPVGEPAKEIKLQTTCPVMGGKIDRNVFVDHEGKRMYLCCKGCIGAVQKDPAKYIRQLQAEGITVAELQKTCPAMGGAINRALFADYQGKRVYVCCQGCIAELKKDPAKFVEKLEAEGVVLDKTP